MKILITIIFFGCIYSIISCKKNTTNNNPPPVDTLPGSSSSIAKGADISWVTQMESQGLQFYNRAGVQQDLYQVFKSEGINAIRLRAWVNPSDNYNSTADLVAKAIRAKNAGMKIMIDFHYSYTLADCGHQATPAA
jgi:arabinogalactan endo-1,4-beta-galactosidase